MAPATRITGASSDGRLHGVATLLVAMHQVDAVVDADTDEGDDREHREQIELDAGQGQDAGRPDEADHRRQQCKEPTAADRGTWRSHSTMTITVPIARPLKNCGDEPRGQLAVHQRNARQRLRRVDVVHDLLQAIGFAHDRAEST